MFPFPAHPNCMRLKLQVSKYEYTQQTILITQLVNRNQDHDNQSRMEINQVNSEPGNGKWKINHRIILKT